MLLKNRLQIYDWTHQKVNYFDPYEFTTNIAVKMFDLQGKEIFLELPRQLETPRDIECYCAGIERITNYTFERRNYIS